MSGGVGVRARPVHVILLGFIAISVAIAGLTNPSVGLLVFGIGLTVFGIIWSIKDASILNKEKSRENGEEGKKPWKPSNLSM